MDNLNLPAGLTVTDIAIILIFLVAAAWGYSKGLVHGILFIGAWVGAVLATVYGYGYAQPYAHELIRISFIADVATAGTIFLISLIVLLLATRMAARRVQESALGVLDRILGFGFGIFSAAVFFALAHMATGWVLPPNDQPEWLTESRTLPLIAEGANVLRSYLPGDFAFSEPDDKTQ